VTGAGPGRPQDAGTARPFAASTLGAPGTDLATVARWVRQAGGEAIELRVADGEPVHLGLDPPGCELVRRTVAEAGIAVLSLATYVRVAACGPDEDAVRSLTEHVELAARLGAPFLRVFPGAETMPGPSSVAPALKDDLEEVDGRAVRRLAAVAPSAGDRGVRLVLETHDSHPRGADVVRVLARLEECAPGAGVGAVWDALHPWRVGEPAEETAALLRPYLAFGRGYVQVKDVVSRDDLTPRLPGEGLLPLGEVMAALDGWYAGCVSLEWERAWYPRVPDLPAALRAWRTWC
jgi:sugar phosphate isomerase/epimerase